MERKAGIRLAYTQETIDWSPYEILSKVLELKHLGYRLVQISCNRLSSGYELYYSFDKEYNMINLRVSLTEITEIISITSVYSCAFLYENEIKELFGVNIDNIGIDYNNHLYKIPVKTPFKQKDTSN